MLSARGMRSETVSRCSQARRETYTALPLATPKVAGADSLAAAFDAIKADPFGFYANVRVRACSPPLSLSGCRISQRMQHKGAMPADARCRAQVHTEESEKRVPDAGQIRGQLRRES